MTTFRHIRDWFFTPRGALVYFGVGYAALAVWLLWPSNPGPTPDQLYGCTIKQQAPNGDCP